EPLVPLHIHLQALLPWSSFAPRRHDDAGIPSWPSGPAKSSTQYLGEMLSKEGRSCVSLHSDAYGYKHEPDDGDCQGYEPIRQSSASVSQHSVQRRKYEK